MKARLASALLILVASFGLKAAIDAYPFPNEELAVRYDALVAELRCPQCLNTNLAGSDAMIAQDLRREVHRMLLEGKSDDEILDFMHERYGDFILYDPKISGATFVLWFGPALLLLLAGFVMYRLISNRPTEALLTEDEQARINQLLDGNDRP